MTTGARILLSLCIALVGSSGGQACGDALAEHYRFIDNDLRAFLEYQLQPPQHSPEDRAEAEYLLGMLDAFMPRPDNDRPPTADGQARWQSAMGHFQRALTAGDGHIGACERIAELSSKQCNADPACNQDQNKWRQLSELRQRCRFVPVRWETRADGTEHLSSRCNVMLGQSTLCHLPKALYHESAPAPVTLETGSQPHWARQEGDHAWRVEPTMKGDARLWRFSFVASRYGARSVPHELEIEVKPPERLQHFGYSSAVTQAFTTGVIASALENSGYFLKAERRSDWDTLKSIAGNSPERDFPTGLIFGNVLLDPELKTRFLEDNGVYARERVGLVQPMSEVVGVLVANADETLSGDPRAVKPIAVVAESDDDPDPATIGDAVSAFLGLLPDESSAKRLRVASVREGCRKLTKGEIAALFTLTASNLTALKGELRTWCGKTDGSPSLLKILPLTPRTLPPGFFNVLLSPDPALGIGPGAATAATEVWWVMYDFGDGKRCKELRDITAAVGERLSRDLRSANHGNQQPDPGNRAGSSIENTLSYESSRLRSALEVEQFKRSGCADAR